MASDTLPPTDKRGKAREKVAVKPGFHLMDWMRLTRTSNNLNTLNGGRPRPISRKELAQHNSEFDCWTAYNGKVYNITQYMHYHPGGVPKLMLGAGKDCTQMYNRYHAWVNIDNMLGKCYIGPLMMDEGINEDEEEEEEEDEEDENLKAADAKDTGDSVFTGMMDSEKRSAAIAALNVEDSGQEDNEGAK